MQALYTEMKEQGVNVIGIVADGIDNEIGVLNILRKTDVTFENIIPNEEFINDFLNKISAVPTSLLVNSDGEIIAKPIVGSRDKEEYKGIIEEALKNIK
ncbi:hypothetical protein SAMN02744040_01808 [Tepidibacter thalassicus DSM 15285]|uniref:AhpC/TSA family protein n=1 Tax=Tepidibacter thalassicus DSM 15285 TaxID=1123350 RepID=A0A1M5SL39_9FIRM|nr:hypothetical protein SAMN02744040_01808 [Tepidibacter thalassicus DSM 15285]